MKSALYGRILFGASAVLFGVITLIWHDADAWQGLPFLSLPLGTIIGACIAIAQIAGGIAIAYFRTARAASIVLGLVYLLFALAGVPGIVAKPTEYVEYGNFFQWFSLVCGSVAVYAVTSRGAARSAMLRQMTRIGFGLCTVSFTLAQIVYFRFTATLVPTWIPPNPAFWTILTTVAFGIAAIAILINVRARLALQLMTLMLALFGILVWVPRLVAHPEAHGNWSEFAVNFLVTGAAWLVAEVTA